MNPSNPYSRAVFWDPGHIEWISSSYDRRSLEMVIRKMDGYAGRNYPAADQYVARCRARLAAIDGVTWTPGVLVCMAFAPVGAMIMVQAVDLPMMDGHRVDGTPRIRGDDARRVSFPCDDIDAAREHAIALARDLGAPILLDLVRDLAIPADAGVEVFRR